MTLPSAQKIPVYLEAGQKRTFACAVDWPGWCRSGAGESAALEALLAYGPRYSGGLGLNTFGFQAPAAVSDFTILTRFKGASAVDFGVPGIIPPMDEDPLDGAGLERLQAILEACWLELERAARLSEGKELRKGPRGGGREREEILRHVIEANGAYLKAAGWKPVPDGQAGFPIQADREALAAASRGELPKLGPRGGKHWPPRYFARRVAWHVLDHAWEIEDRIL